MIASTLAATGGAGATCRIASTAASFHCSTRSSRGPDAANPGINGSQPPT
jgi:hypothetical protein